MVLSRRGKIRTSIEWRKDDEECKWDSRSCGIKLDDGIGRGDSFYGFDWSYSFETESWSIFCDKGEDTKLDWINPNSHETSPFNPSPYSMQQLASNLSIPESSHQASWRHSLFNNLNKEGFDLTRYLPNKLN